MPNWFNMHNVNQTVEYVTLSFGIGWIWHWSRNENDSWSLLNCLLRKWFPPLIYKRACAKPRNWTFQGWSAPPFARWQGTECRCPASDSCFLQQFAAWSQFQCHDLVCFAPLCIICWSWPAAPINDFQIQLEFGRLHRLRCVSTKGDGTKNRAKTSFILQCSATSAFNLQCYSISQYVSLVSRLLKYSSTIMTTESTLACPLCRGIHFSMVVSGQGPMTTISHS